jgi:UDP-3-O-[3-hydroxymyristoyl] glucosamine N-acyltransferase
VLNRLASDLKEQGVHKLRLDCDASNSRLTSYYEQQGYVKVGEKKTPFSVNNLYERILYLGPMKESSKSYTAKELSELLNGELIGDSSHVIIGPEQIEMAGSNHITFIGNQKYVPLWQTSKASVAVIDKKFDLEEPGENRAFIKVGNADLAMAQLLELFRPEPVDLEPGIHPSAFVHESSRIGQNVTIGPNAYIGKGASIGDNTIIFPNVSVLDDVVIGDHCQIRSGSVISERCILGNHCLIQSNVSIGSDGFGYRPSPDGRGIVKIVHIGNVVIGNHVEIGSSTCIDRGKFSSTIIGDGTKIDNLVQIGHNCKIGRSCMIAGCCGISGSVTMGDGVIMAGQVAVKDHVTIGNGVTVGGKSGIINDIPDGQTILGFPAVPAKETLKQWAILKRMVRGKS